MFFVNLYSVCVCMHVFVCGETVVIKGEELFVMCLSLCCLNMHVNHMYQCMNARSLFLFL